ncbi:MAG: PD-(D/E)XK nuclease family protein [Thermoplasmata archaeon]|nr:PD-(D/E)XK nuclease family protein [Thermoplasmata archaeon]
MILSYSKISEYLKCPLMYYFDHIEHIPKKRSKYAVFGIAFHEALNYYYITKEGIKRIRAVFENAIEDLNEDEENEKVEEKELEEAKKTGGGLLQKYLPQFQEYKINDMEKEVMFNIGGIDMIGYIDYVLKDGTILDIKTSKRKWQEKDVRNSIQLALYALAYRDYTGKKEKTIQIDNIVKTRKPQVNTIVIPPYSDQELERSSKVVYGVANAIEKNVFYPTDPNNWWCGKNCPFYQYCQKYLGKS